MPSTYDYNPSLVPLNVISVCYQAPSADYDENCAMRRHYQRRIETFR